MYDVRWLVEFTEINGWVRLRTTVEGAKHQTFISTLVTCHCMGDGRFPDFQRLGFTTGLSSIVPKEAILVLISQTS
jgi:hypothetical protein